MKAAVLYGPRDLRLEDVAPPEMGPDDVLISVRSVGICGSDVHYLQSGRIGDFVVREPMILGHETAGVVVDVGANVKGLRVGDRVAVEPGIPCRTCEPCKTGRYNLCPDVRFLATPPVDGSLCELIVSPADFAYKVPDHVTLDEAALIEPLSVGLHACRRGGVTAGSTVLITGAGPIGLTCVMTALAFGATRVFVTDLQEHRLRKAEELGATAALVVGKDDVREAVLELTEGRGVDVAIECSGAERALHTCVQAAKPGGRVVLVGLGADDLVTVPMVHVATKELDLVGIFRYVYTYPAAIELVSTGRIDMKKLITHRFSLDEVHKGFEYAEKGIDGAIKVMIEVG